MIQPIFKALALTIITLTFSSQALAFEQNFYSFSQGTAANDLLTNADKIDTVLPQSYEFGRNLRLNRVADGGVHQAARDTDTKLIPLVYQQNFDQNLMTAILRIESLQKLMINQLIAEAKTQDYEGWQYDFENIATIDRDRYSDFVERSYKAFQDEGLEFSVAIVPRTADFRPGVDFEDYSSAYDLKAIAENSDYVTLMAYNDPNSVGPTASLPYVERVVDYALTKAPASKLSLGVPMYCSKWYVNDGYRFRNSISQRLTQEDVDESLFSIEKYNESLESEMYLYVVQSGNIYITWCDGAQGLAEKIDVVEENNLRGISAWSLGQEVPEVWSVLD